MEKSFEIKFDFPVAHSDISVALKATAELHHSDPYYIVHSFRYPSTDTHKQTISILPVQEIKVLEKGKQRLWVHRDSERESLLSRALGKAIDSRNG